MDSSEINIIGSKIFKGSSLIDADISIANGKIIKIGKQSNLPEAEEEIDAKGLLTLPGLIDAHVHLRDMRRSHKEDFFTGTCASAAGGFTTVLDMPNTIPTTDSCERLQEKISVAKKKVVVNIGFHAMLSDRLHELSGMAQMGVISFKLYLNKPQSDLDIENDEHLQNTMQECVKLGTPLTIHAEEFHNAKAEEIDSFEYLVKKYEEKLEINAIKRILSLIKGSGVQAHICHISSAKSLSLIEEAKKNGTNVSCEVTPHHIFLSNKSFKEFGTLALTDPPIRSKATTKKLWDALVNGSIDIIASDHAPHTIKEKLCSSLDKVPFGIPGLETTLPLLLTEVNSGKLTLRRLVEVLAEKPAEIFHLKNKGFLEEGNDADLTLIDLKAKHKIESEKSYSKAEYSPFEGMKCKGKVVKVLVSGNIVMDSGKIVENPGIGGIVTR